jgi:hypothetical protein
MRKNTILFSGLLFFSMVLVLPAIQEIETKRGIRLVHNQKSSLLPGVELKLIHKIGGLEEKDENLAFGSPYDVDIDSNQNIYVLDARNSHIQKLDPQGRFIQSIGRRGQGPGEFQGIFSFDIDSEDRIYVYESQNMRIQVINNKGETEKTFKFDSFSMNQIRVQKSGYMILARTPRHGDFSEDKKTLPKLLRRLDTEGSVRTQFGDITDYRDANVNVFANWMFVDIDRKDNIYLTFMYQNRIDKYSPDGKLLWKADRKLNYKTDVMDKGFVHRDSKGTSIQAPKMNMVSTGLAADHEGRLWVITFNRQMSEEEMGATVSSGGSVRVIQEPKIKKMDIFTLEVFGSDGIIIGEVPLNHLAHGIRIVGDNLFIWERDNAAVYQYKIVSKKS